MIRLKQQLTRISPGHTLIFLRALRPFVRMLNSNLDNTFDKRRLYGQAFLLYWYPAVVFQKIFLLNQSTQFVYILQMNTE